MDIQTAVGLFLLALAVGTYGSIIGAGGGFLMVSGLVLAFDLTGATAVGTSIVTTLAIQITDQYAPALRRKMHCQRLPEPRRAPGNENTLAARRHANTHSNEFRF